jgi:hypothetical protein
VIKANQVLPAVVGEVIRKAPLSDEKVSFDKATRVRLDAEGTLHVSAEPAWLDGVRQSVGLIRSRLAHFLGEQAVKRIAYEDA